MLHFSSKNGGSTGKFARSCTFLTCFSLHGSPCTVLPARQREDRPSCISRFSQKLLQTFPLKSKVGIKDSSLHKHFRSKRMIFEGYDDVEDRKEAFSVFEIRVGEFTRFSMNRRPYRASSFTAIRFISSIPPVSIAARSPCAYSLSHESQSAHAWR